MTRPTILMLVTLLSIAPMARGDAVMTTRAMKATTIAEVFIERDAVRVEFEIGAGDLEAFRNLMPDELIEMMGGEPEPLLERVARFFAEDLLLSADGAPLEGRPTGIEKRRRLPRDEVSGDPLEGSDGGEDVLLVVLTYPLDHEPAELTFAKPEGGVLARAEIGFVVYHRGLPVNDFRYWPASMALDLTWDDPWFSRFRNTNLRRRYDAPVSVFLYVDHFEVRKEIVLRPRDLEPWLDFELEDPETITIAEQAEIKRQIGEFLTPRGAVTVDGLVAEPTLDRIHFLRRTLRQAGIIDPPEDLDAASATLGVIFVYPITELPQEVTVDWDLFSDRVASVPGMATDEAGGLPWRLTPEDPVLTWTNYLKNPSSRALVEIAAPSTTARLRVSFSIVALLAWAIALVVLRRRQANAWTYALTSGAMVVLAAALWPLGALDLPNPFARSTEPTDADARVIVNGLLRNTYRAFDFRDENVIYDTLERSISGDVLRQVYLEAQRALELQSQGGARARVSDVDIVDLAMTEATEETGFASRCVWNVIGSVGHWGHLHQRRNQYEAELTVRPVDGVWKITGLRLLSEQRLDNA